MNSTHGNPWWASRIDSDRLSTKKAARKPSAHQPSRTPWPIERSTVIAVVAAISVPTRNAPGQPSCTSRSIQPLWALGTGHWVSLRTQSAGTDSPSRPQKAP